MSYVIVKGKSNRALNDFEFNGLPVKSNATMWQMIENPESCYSNKLFHFYNDCASSYRTIEEAEHHISQVSKTGLRHKGQLPDCCELRS